MRVDRGGTVDVELVAHVELDAVPDVDSPAAASERTSAGRSDDDSTDGVDDDQTTIPRGVAFDILSCRRRRNAIHCLRRAEEPLSLRTLSEWIAAWENDVDVEQVTYKQRMRVYTALKQSHLPKLDESGVIDYDADRSVSKLTEATADIECYLDVVPNDDLSWSQYYLGVALLSVAFPGLSWLGVAPLASVSGFGWVVLIAATLGVSAIAHRFREWKYHLGSDGPPPEHQ